MSGYKNSAARLSGAVILKLFFVRVSQDVIFFNFVPPKLLEQSNLRKEKLYEREKNKWHSRIEYPCGKPKSDLEYLVFIRNQEYAKTYYINQNEAWGQPEHSTRSDLAHTKTLARIEVLACQKLAHSSH
jgi:hypothetical protein